MTVMDLYLCNNNWAPSTGIKIVAVDGSAEYGEAQKIANKYGNEKVDFFDVYTIYIKRTAL